MPTAHCTNERNRYRPTRREQREYSTNASQSTRQLEATGSEQPASEQQPTNDVTSKTDAQPGTPLNANVKDAQLHSEQLNQFHHEIETQQQAWNGIEASATAFYNGGYEQQANVSSYTTPLEYLKSSNYHQQYEAQLQQVDTAALPQQTYGTLQYVNAPVLRTNALPYWPILQQQPIHMPNVYVLATSIRFKR